MSKTSILILRVILSLVLFYFGFSQILNPEAWTYFVDFNPFGFNSLYIVLVNGVVEVICGFLILFDFYRKPVAILMGLHLVVITITIGFNPTGVRDLAIAGAFFSLAFTKR